ncbi:MAG: alanine racemase [Pseudomonadota bacterium]
MVLGDEGWGDHAGRLRIDLGALTRNWRHLNALCGAAACGAVVKADGYGLGLERVGRALHRAGARTFFVAHLGEGERLRAALPDAVIYILNGLPPGGAARLLASRLRPVLGSVAELDEWLAHPGAERPAALHVDTGMNRLGLSMEEAGAVAASARDLSPLHLLMSHLACADEADHPLTEVQTARFAEARALFPDIPGSLANSAGVLRAGAMGHDLARPGIALYGASALAEPSALETVATLAAPVLQVRDVAVGETVGYGATWTARRPTRAAILSAGYADGFLRASGATDDEKGHAGAFDGMMLPFIGRVSMDLIAIDATDVPTLRRGDLVELLGPNASVDAAARSAGTIPYEFLTGLGARYRRETLPQ